jgi:hypothetical protein
MNVYLIRGGADKSLSQPGRKQATPGLNSATQFLKAENYVF